MKCLPLRNRLLAALAVSLAAGSVPAAAQTAQTPYWASINAEEVNLRVGPSTTYPIDWVYTRPGLPVKVMRVNEGWRLVEDPDGVRGWMVARMLARDRRAIVVGDGAAEIVSDPSDEARTMWYVEPGVTGALGDCAGNWCRFDVSGHAGWIEQDRLWGAGEP